MSAVWTSARAAVRAHRGALAGSALVAALAAALLTATGVWVEAGLRLAASSDDPAASLLITVASSFAGTAVLIALFVVASTFAGALRPRAREFALLRAVGATTAQVRNAITAEVLLVFAVTAPVGAVPGLLLAPLLTGVLVDGGIAPAGFAPALSPWPVLAALALLVPTALLGARLAGRESARLSPASAVQRSAVEPAGIGSVRRAVALGLGAVGLLAAGTPFVVPGLLGSAAATTSALLLLVAAALLGPVLVRRVAERGLALLGGRGGAVPTLALANARGFSRRLTGAVIPLALLLALGTVQSGVNRAVVDATGEQVRQAITADLVAQAPDGVTAAEATAVAALPGVAASGRTGLVPAQVRLDREDADVPVLGGLAWEPTTLRTVPADAGLVDADVRSGSLADLAADGTVAISRETALTGMVGVGDPVDIRTGGEQTEFRVVAVYERGLGLGEYLVGDGTALADAATDAVLLVTAAPGTDDAALAEAVAATGLGATDVDGYAGSVREAAAGQQGLSTALLLALLAFVAVAAGTTLVNLVGTRRAELALLHRTGATRRQLLRVVAVESVLTTATALLVGAACVLPALLGVGQGLLRVPLPVVDPVVLGGLVVVVALIGLTLPVAAAVRATASTRAA
ncbi:ABC transporter permease [Cellulomonas triticagri]|uniref:ABC transporter permease n=1 Tax=Cellulomonas triticagri TaxID=2483352 RepID=A0A3M2JE79_9CELL|nr:ABC transporter permease [Cellulomonas triticagri]RMI09255.1 ABC transporter permease [Cellulomonas triticagri]